jgi:hypothetical protein
MRITEGELRSIIRQIIIEDVMMNEGILQNIAPNILKALMFLMLITPNSAAAKSLNKFLDTTANEISETYELSKAQKTELFGLAARISDKVNDSSTEEEAKNATQEVTKFAQRSNVPARAWFAYLKKVANHVKEKVSRSDNSSFPHKITDDNVEVKSKGNFYYLYHKAYNLYYKAPKEHLDKFINEDFLHDTCDELANDKVEDRDTGDDDKEIKAQQIKRYLKIVERNPTEIENELVIMFKALIDGEYTTNSRNYDKYIVIKPEYQQKLKAIWDSIK